MQEISLNDLTPQEKEYCEKAFEAAEHSFSKSGNKVGAVLVCENGTDFSGATVGRSRVIGSTCAERMAMDQIFYHGFSKPVLVVTVGFLAGSPENTITFPCGVCRQMYQEYADNDLKFILVSWDKSRVIRTTLGELFPGGQGYYLDPTRQNNH